jgi:hypothetical protein
MVEADGPWSDVPDPVEEDVQALHEERTDIIEEMDFPNEEDMTIQARKVTTSQDKVFQSPAADLEVSSSSPTERVSDATSIRSLPIVQMTEPASPSPRPATARGSDLRSNIVEDSDGAVSQSLRPHRTASTNHDRRRSTYIDVRYVVCTSFHLLRFMLLESCYQPILRFLLQPYSSTRCPFSIATTSHRTRWQT